MEISALPKDKKIILFDGLCNLCDASVQFIIKHDKKDVFRFAAQQSEIGQKIINHIGIDALKLDGIILYESDKPYCYKAKAVLKIVTEFDGFWVLFKLSRILPFFLLDAVYNYMAKNRYKWYGKKEVCMIPTKDIQEKFLL